MATDTAPSPARGYSATKDELLTRLRRIEGQTRGIQAMVVDDRWCPEILQQIAAVRASHDRRRLAHVELRCGPIAVAGDHPAQQHGRAGGGAQEGDPGSAHAGPHTPDDSPVSGREQRPAVPLSG